jgi:hypothetical protein
MIDAALYLSCCFKASSKKSNELDCFVLELLPMLLKALLTLLAGGAPYP